MRDRLSDTRGSHDSSISGPDSLAGKQAPDGRLIARHAKAPESNLEVGRRDAKGWLCDIVAVGYKPTRDQAALTKLVDIDTIRARNLRVVRTTRDRHVEPAGGNSI